MDYESLLVSQHLEIMNAYMEKWRESEIRSLKLSETRRLYLSDEYFLMRSSIYTSSLQDILNKHMANNTSFPTEYPDNDRSVISN